MFAAGKHQVLEQMGKPGLARRLVARPCMHPEVEGHQRQAMVLDQDHLEAVGQPQLFMFDRQASVVGNDGPGRVCFCQIRRGRHGANSALGQQDKDGE